MGQQVLKHAGVARKPRGLWARLRADNRGATMIEFAVVSIPLIATLLACVQTSLIYFAQQNLETAGESSARQILTGASQKANQTQAQFLTAACAKLPSFMDCTKLYVDVRTATSFSDATTTPPTITYGSNGKPNNAFTFAPGNAGDIVIFRLMYLWPVNPGPLGLNLGQGGNTRLLIATSVFKAEPYQS